MSEQVGWRGLLRNIRQESQQWSVLLPQLPRLLHRVLADRSSAETESAIVPLLLRQQRRIRLLSWVVAALVFSLILLIFSR